MSEKMGNITEFRLVGTDIAQKRDRSHGSN